jgi:transcriptional regulator with XRE-family HTH domain
LIGINNQIWKQAMPSLKSTTALERLGQDVRSARLVRGMSIADLAVRADTSASSVARLEKGDRGVGIGTLADILVVLGLIERLGDLIDIRKDSLGLSLVPTHIPKRGKSYAAALRQQRRTEDKGLKVNNRIDPDGVGF